MYQFSNHSFRKFQYLVGTSILTSGLISPSVQAAEGDKPNVIIILVDDLGFSGIGSYGGLIETPHIDQLAEDGVRFNQFFTTSRSCPSRASLMTGLYPTEVGVGHMVFRPNPAKNEMVPEDRMYIPAEYRGWLIDKEDVHTLPEMMQTAGYSTYISGKWHLHSTDTMTWPLQRGFDKYYGVLPGTTNYFKPAELYRGNTHIQASGERYYTTDAFTSEAIGFLQEHQAQKADDPFFLYLAYNAPHFPIQAMPEDFAKYRGRFMEGWDVLRQRVYERQLELGVIPADTKLTPPAGVSTRLGSQGDSIPSWESLTPKQKDRMDAIMASYAGMVDRVDQNVGKLIAYLKETNQFDNTLIFFFSDNGGEAESNPLGSAIVFEELGVYGGGSEKHAHYGKAWANFVNTPFREFKHFAHQGGIQSPLIVHWPQGVKKGMENSILPQYAFLQDITLTCLDVAGVKWPSKIGDNNYPITDGRSITPTLKGKKKAIHNTPIFYEHEGNRVVRLGKWKLVGFYDEPWELYDMDKDRSEMNNVADKNPKVVKQLSKAYNAWMVRAGVLPWSQAKEYSVYPKGRYNL